mgnify:CR=1 FL=1
MITVGGEFACRLSVVYDERGNILGFDISKVEVREEGAEPRRIDRYAMDEAACEAYVRVKAALSLCMRNIQ